MISPYVSKAPTITQFTTGVATAAISTSTASISSFVVPTGTTLLHLSITAYTTPSGSTYVSSVSWNGSTTGWVSQCVTNNGTNGGRVEHYYLKSPTATTSTLTVTLIGAATSVWGFMAVPLAGTAQTSPEYGCAGTVYTSGVTTATNSITALNTGDLFVDGLAWNVTAGTTYPVASGSQVQTNITESAVAGPYMNASTLVILKPGSTAMTWTGNATTAGVTAHGMVGIAR